MATLVYRYGVTARGNAAQRQEMVSDALVLEQLRLAHDLRNALVEVEHFQEEAMRALWSGFPDVAAAEARLAAAEEEVAAAEKQARAEHSADRSTATRPATAATIREARAAVKQAKVDRKAAIGAAYPLAKPKIEALRDERQTAIRALYADFVQTRGLYWASYNAVLDDHKTAVKMRDRKRKAGQPAQLRFKRWTGEGTISVQLQRQAGDPARTPPLLASGGGKWRNVFRLHPWIDPAEFAKLPLAQRRRVAAGEATWCVGGGRLVTIPVRVHRMIPAEADIAMAQLTRTRVGGHYQLALAVTVKLPDPEPVQERPTVALHLGWRKRPDDTTRVATWASTAVLPVPASVADVVVTHGGRWGEIVTPPRLAGAGRPAVIASTRATAFGPVLDTMATWLAEHPEACDERLTPALVRQWRSPARLAALVWRWRAEPPADSGELLEVLEAWRRQDKHLWEFEAHERRQLAAHRDDAWRRAACWLARHAAVIVVDDANLADLRQRDDEADTDPAMPGDAAQTARARAALAAPGRLRQLATVTAAREGVTVHSVPSAGLTRLHRKCGHQAPADPRYAASAVVTCPACGNGYDQDYNAAMLMLERAQQQPDRAGRAES